MANNKIYDFVVIGGGISSCVFVSSLIKNGFNGRIAIIENGRNLGGRSSTRNSLTNKGWRLNHGSPNFNICNSNNDKLIKTFIKELLDSNIIQNDTSDVVQIYKGTIFDSEISFDFYRGANYISNNSMAELSKKIIFNNNLRNQIDFFFETWIVKL